MKLFSHSLLESTALLRRLRGRAYLIVVIGVATILLVAALKRPTPASVTAQETLTVPPLAGSHNRDSVQPSCVQRLRSKELIESVGMGLHVTDGLPADEARKYLDTWTTRVRRSLTVSEKPNATEKGTCVTIRYDDVTPESSVTVLTSLLQHVVDNPPVTSFGASAEPLSDTPSDEVLDAKDRVISVENAIEKFVTEQIERRREELFALRVQQAEAQHRAQVLLSGDKELSATANRNQEYDVVERALAKSKTERQELLTRFAMDHAAVSRVDLEIGQLELLLDQTAKSSGGAGVEPEPTDRGQEAGIGLESGLVPGFANAVPLPPEEIDMELELARIEKLDAHRELQRGLVEAQEALAAVIDRSTKSSGFPMITKAPRVVGHHQPRLSIWRLVAFGAVTGLVIFTVLQNFVKVPADLYSVKDVKKSLGLPITAYLSLNN